MEWRHNPLARPQKRPNKRADSTLTNEPYRLNAALDSGKSEYLSVLFGIFLGSDVYGSALLGRALLEALRSFAPYVTGEPAGSAVCYAASILDTDLIAY